MLVGMGVQVAAVRELLQPLEPELLHQYRETTAQRAMETWGEGVAVRAVLLVGKTEVLEEHRP